METAIEITDLADSAEASRFKDLFTRQDRDFERWDLSKKGHAYDYDPLVKIQTGAYETDIDVTPNKTRTFSDNVQSILSSSERQISVRMAEVEGKDMRGEMGKLERLLEFAFEKADERLLRMLLPTLKDSLVWYSMVRGWVAGRFLVYKSGDKVVFDFLPLDPRWLTYGVGANGLVWTAYKTFRESDELASEYEKRVGTKWWKPWEKKKEFYPVIDYWKNEGERNIINGVTCESVFLKKPEKYDMLSMPNLIQPVPTRPPVRGESGSQFGGYGESIFAPNRDIDDLLAKMGSIWASHANLLSKQPIVNYRTDKGKVLKDTIHYAGGVMNLPMGENRLEPVPMKEISPTLVNLMQWLDAQQTQGSLPNVDIGSPPPSGTLYNLVQETSNRVFNPQLRNLSSFYASACRLIEEQLLTNKLKVDIQGVAGHKYYEEEVKPVDLKESHITKVVFTARTPWTQMDTYQIAQMAKQIGLPDKFIHEHILMIPDPQGLEEMSAMELAERSPNLAMLKAIDGFMKRGMQDEAEQLMRDMFNMAQQEGAPPEQGPSPPNIGGI